MTDNKTAAKIFSRYISLNPKDTAVKFFISGLLTLTYGDPVFYRRARPVYAVICNRKKLPPLRLDVLDVEGARPHVKLTVKVEPESELNVKLEGTHPPTPPPNPHPSL